MSDQPVIRPAARLVGKKLVLREVETGDAGFILSLRLDPKKGAHLSPVDDDVSKQVAWIERYKAGGGQAYFIICTKNPDGSAGERIGTVRLYNAKGDSFSWGSWIIADGAAPDVAMESALIVYQYALDHLGFRNSHFEVNRDNRTVWNFHERLFGARRVGENEVEYFFEQDHDAIRAAMRRYGRFLPDPIEVVPLDAA
jgi:RimJ/RimL family protein N-acetyltransferase